MPRIQKVAAPAEPVPARATTIERRATAELVPYAQNSRTHSEGQVAQIASSITEFGFTNPVLVDPANGIIAGHGRVLAAQLLGLAEVPVIVLAHLSDAQRRAYVIADNKLALNAGWDAEPLKLELDDLSAGGFDLALVGFDPVELADLKLQVENPPPAPEPERDLLRWGDTEVEMTFEEKADLLALFERHVEAFGVPYGFVRERLMGEG